MVIQYKQADEPTKSTASRKDVSQREQGVISPVLDRGNAQCGLENFPWFYPNLSDVIALREEVTR